MEIRQNTLYLTTAGTYVSRDHLTLRIEVDRELKLALPIHHLESICVFGPISISPQALQLCWENGVSVNCFSEGGYYLGRWEGIANTSVMLRRDQFRAADDKIKASKIVRPIVAGKIQNARQSLLRSARENNAEDEAQRLQNTAEELGKLLRNLNEANEVGQIRGLEGRAAAVYFQVFDLHLKQQREEFSFRERSRRPPRDPINCLLSFLYALLLHDAIAALSATGLDPYVGFLHVDRPARPGFALDLIEEFRPLLADRLAMTLVNRKQIQKGDFNFREGGAVEFTDQGRKTVLTAYQTRKQDVVTHPLLEQECRIGQLMLIQSRIMARYLRGELPEYIPCILR